MWVNPQTECASSNFPLSIRGIRSKEELPLQLERGAQAQIATPAGAGLLSELPTEQTLPSARRPVSRAAALGRFAGRAAEFARPKRPTKPQGGPSGGAPYASGASGARSEPGRLRAMLAAILNSLSNTLVLLLVGAFGWWIAHSRRIDPERRGLVAKIVNLCIPCFLFASVTGKFSHDELLGVLQAAWIPFITVAVNWLISVLLVRAGLVRPQWRGIFISCFTSSTVLFVGVPVTMALFGEAGIPYLLVYFFANCLFIWTIGLFNIELDGVARRGGEPPRLVSAQSVRMLFSPPLLAFLAAVAVVAAAVPVPGFVSGTAKMIGQITSPLAIIFIGMTIEGLGFARLRHVPREIWLVLLSCFVLRPLVMVLVTAPLDLPLIMRQVFVAGAALPVSSVVAVLAKNFGADEEFASEAIGASTLGLVFALPFILTLVNLIG